RTCPAGSTPRGSAVVGHVNNPETLEPIAGAEVSVAWTEVEVSKNVGIRQTPHLVRDTTDSSGSFRICGLPSSLNASLQARRGSAVTGEIPIALGDAPQQLFARTLSLAPTDSASRTGNATVSGVVVLEGAATNAGSRVELTGTDIVAMTDQNGEFTMRNLPSGSKVLLARHLGFAAETVPVELSSRQPQQVTIKLARFVAVMDPVLVTARRTAALDKVGFSQRMKSGMGYYMGPERLQRMHPIFLTDILRQVPGLRVSYGPHGETISSSRGFGSNCVQYWVDDMPWMSVEPGDLNHFVTGGEVVAVEVYQDTGTPARYMRAGGSCTTIVLWTRFKIRS
ncbi:MAG: TonB-dependent receptor, partial [Gemmatimonadota bacterium]|nr:TonB-dependent receptor [Gemmatimonadota bacterium]